MVKCLLVIVCRYLANRPLQRYPEIISIVATMELLLLRVAYNNSEFSTRYPIWRLFTSFNTFYNLFAAPYRKFPVTEILLSTRITFFSMKYYNISFHLVVANKKKIRSTKLMLYRLWEKFRYAIKTASDSSPYTRATLEGGHDLLWCSSQKTWVYI